MGEASAFAILTGLVLLAPAAIRGQEPSRLSFEVASVKSSPPSSDRSRLGGGPGTDDPGWARYRNVPMRIFLMQAYALKDYQLAGPTWLDAQKYDVGVRVPPEATRKQFNAMMQGLLAERFGLKIHHETRSFAGYELLLAKNGPRLKTPEPPSVETAALIAAGARGAAIKNRQRWPTGAPAGSQSHAHGYNSGRRPDVGTWTGTRCAG